jgi:hypothetical protein
MITKLREEYYYKNRRLLRRRGSFIPPSFGGEAAVFSEVLDKILCLFI